MHSASTLNLKFARGLTADMRVPCNAIQSIMHQATTTTTTTNHSKFHSYTYLHTNKNLTHFFPPFLFLHIASWEEQEEANATHHQHPARASPGVGGSSPSSASWRSGTPSPPLSDQGTWTGSSSSTSNGCSAAGPSQDTHNNNRYYTYRGQTSRRSSPCDEGIGSDLENERHPRKKVSIAVNLNDTGEMVNTGSTTLRTVRVGECSWSRINDIVRSYVDKFVLGVPTVEDAANLLKKVVESNLLE